MLAGALRRLRYDTVTMNAGVDGVTMGTIRYGDSVRESRWAGDSTDDSFGYECVKYGGRGQASRTGGAGGYDDGCRQD